MEQLKKNTENIEDEEQLKAFRTCDLHCDTVLELLDKEDRREPSSFRQNMCCVDFEKLRKGNYLIQTLALFTDRLAGRTPEHQALRLYTKFLNILEENPELIQIKTRSDLDKCIRENRTGILLSLEEGDVMFQDPELLELWAAFGLRMIALTWNYKNAIGFPNFTVDENWNYKNGNPMLIIDEEHGLCSFGKEFVEKMNEKGILCDVSHLSDAGFWDVIETSRLPVIASHSNARALCPVSRNLSDEMILAIAKTGGVIGINFCADFLNPDSGNVSRIEDIVRHILYIRELAGIDYIALGTDFDGIASDLEIEDASCMGRLYQALMEAGLSNEEINKIASQNFVRVLKSVLK